MESDKDFMYAVFIVLILFFAIIYMGLNYKQTILEKEIQIDKLTIERDLYKNLVEVEKDE